mmetsp:Transcript_0/g.1  ORF Transcript_0/g.1 Transcript_0/m.1 type:complete len:106 (-) Transcript_0:357-674(-)
MPPRYPHGLKKPPTDMSLFEKGVFAALGTSISIGIFQLATSPWGEAGSSGANEEGVTFGESVKSFLMSACPVKFDDKGEKKIESSEVDEKTGATGAEDTKVDFGR